MKNAIKQQLREKAKNHVTTMGVLAVKNNTTGKQYIKGTLNLEALVNKMKFLLTGNSFESAQLQEDWNEYGGENFSFEFMTIIPVQENPYINYRKEIVKAEQTAMSEINRELLYTS
ncbi:GIY-YIG nuclease family protein [Chryseobacterium indologenes]|uniref:GIY-YIG nuclease family protein n=1 Tax=Chryseobacterium indologenes TaxID=253 RepID=UPI0023E75DA4|nr:GIY-YIG nuclease family protein [Chryseobacterium indologenes]WET48828.1 GIY-YIG nuclease family protein [Chryseobacterium indologenes]